MIGKLKKIHKESKSPWRFFAKADRIFFLTLYLIGGIIFWIAQGFLDGFLLWTGVWIGFFLLFESGCLYYRWLNKKFRKKEEKTPYSY